MNTAQRAKSRAKQKYRADPMSIYRVLGRVEPFTPAEQSALNLPVRIAFESLRTGKAEESDFHTLAAAVNISMICAEKIDPLVEQSCVAGRDALMRVHKRHTETGRWGLDGPAFAEIELALQVYEQLVSLLTGGQLKDAMSEVIRRMQAGDVLQPLQ